MNENKKTLLFLVVAAACLALALFTNPTKRDPSDNTNRMGQALFESFDPRDATGIEIVEIDEENLDAKSIEVAQTPKGWFIRRPGKPDYPANADNQVKDVSTILFDLQIIDQAGEGAGEHAKFGVVDPTKGQPGDPGIGKMIALKNSSGSNLAQLIIGNEVEGLSSTRFVRKPDENSVYRVEIQNVGDVSTKFVDWVEKDFLDLDKWNVKRVTLDNYEVNLAKGQLNRQNPPFVLDYADSEWKLSGSPITDLEELNKDKLDGMKDAFDDLEIIDAERKPEILVNNLRQGNEFFSNLKDAKNQAVVQSLQQKGFYTVAVQNPEGETVPKVVSNKGEILVGMKDGVEYACSASETSTADPKRTRMPRETAATFTPSPGSTNNSSSNLPWRRCPPLWSRKSQPPQRRKMPRKKQSLPRKRVSKVPKGTKASKLLLRLPRPGPSTQFHPTIPSSGNRSSSSADRAGFGCG